MSHEHSLQEVYKTEKARFLGFVRRRMRDLAHTDAEDVVADVFANLWARTDLVAEVENLVGYVYGALAHRIQDVLRQRSSASREEPDPEDFPDPAADVEAAAAAHQLRDRLAKALETLSSAERAVWIATELEGRSFRELAKHWDLPIGTLLSRKSRATAHLRILLDEYQPHRSS